MNNPLKTSVINRTDTEDFEKLCMLLKRFTIDTFIRNKPEYSQLRGKNNNDLVNKAINEFEGHEDLSILSSRDIEELKISIQEQINIAKSLIENGTKGSAETRYYILKDGINAVAFMQAQISKNKDKNRIEGWRNLAFVEPEYSGKDGETIDTYGNIHKSMYAKVMYDDISQWFEENNVSYERTCTGVNMLHNIQTYVWYNGFLPYDKNERNIFLAKDLNEKIDKKTLAKVYNLYCKNRDRNKTKNKKSITEEVESTTEFRNLSEEQKRGLVDCFLKEEEKEITLPNGEQISVNDYSDEFFKDESSGVYTITPQELGKKTINATTLKKNETDKVEETGKSNTKDKGDVGLNDN